MVTFIKLYALFALVVNRGTVTSRIQLSDLLLQYMIAPTINQALTTGFKMLSDIYLFMG